MANFGFDLVEGVKPSSVYFKPGIHEATFTDIEKGSVDGPNGNILVIDFSFTGADGEMFRARYFDPGQQGAVRGQMQWGENPSALEQLMISIKQIIEALNYEAYEKIENKQLVISAATFSEFVDKIIEILKPSIGTKTTIKLIPQGSYVQFPKYPASINRSGKLYVSSKFIGKGLVLTAHEKTLIDNYNSAKPTKMETKGEDLLSEVKEDLDNLDDDLPF